MNLGCLCDLLELGVIMVVVWCKIQLNSNMTLTVFLPVWWKVLVLPIILYTMIKFYEVEKYIETQKEKE